MTPANDHAERFVLAAALVPKWYDEIAQAVPDPAMFNGERNRVLYRAIQALQNVGAGIDAHTIAAELRRSGDIGAAPSQWSAEALAAFIADVPSEVINYASHAEEVRGQWVRREMIVAAANAKIAALDQTIDAHAALDATQTRFSRIAESSTRTMPPTIGDVARKAAEMIAGNRARAFNGGLVGIPSGIHAIDRITFGWLAPRAVIIGANTSIGKTALLFTQVDNALRAGYGAAVYSWEEEPEMLFTRIAAKRSRVNGQLAVYGRLDDGDQARLDAAMTELAAEPLEIVGAFGWSALDVRAHARSLKRRMPSLAIIGIDYVQKLRPLDARADKRIQIGDTSDALFKMTRSIGVVCFTLAQLNRGSSKGETKVPNQSDLQEAGNLEQDADSILLIHRPEYYGIESWHDTGQPCEGQARILLTKHRGGRTEPNGVTVAYHKEWAEFADADPDPHAPAAMPDARYSREW